MLIDINPTELVSNRIAEGHGLKNSIGLKGSEEGTMPNQNPEKADRPVREGLKAIDQNVLGNLPVRKDESRPENVRKWKRMARKIRIPQTEGNGNQKENMTGLDYKRGLQQVEVAEQLNQEGSCKKLKQTETVSCTYNDQVGVASLELPK